MTTETTTMTRRKMLMRLGLAATAAYAAPVMLQLSHARASGASGGASGASGGPGGGGSAPSGGRSGPSSSRNRSGSGPSGLVRTHKIRVRRVRRAGSNSFSR